MKVVSQKDIKLINRGDVIRVLIIKLLEQPSSAYENIIMNQIKYINETVYKVILRRGKYEVN